MDVPRLRRRTRHVALRLHHTISLVLGVWMIAMAVTGTVLVVLGEANALLRPAAYHRTSGDVGAERAVAGALAAHPNTTLTRLTTPLEAEGVYRVDLVDRSGVERRYNVDPGSGRIIGDVTFEVPVLRFARRLHTGLLRDSWGPFTGERVVATLGIGWAVSLLAGAWTWWWPRVRVRHRHGNRNRARSRSRQRGPRRSHRLIAAVLVGPLAIVVVTGIAFQYSALMRPVYDVLTLGTDEARSTVAPRSTSPTGQTATNTGVSEPVDWRTATQVAGSLAPSSRLLTVEVPRSPTGTYRVRVQLGATSLGLVSGARVVTIEVDRFTGTVAAVVDPLADSAATQGFEDWRRPLHVGTFGGPVTRVAWLLIGPGVVAAAVTGWGIRRRRRANRRLVR